MEAERSDLPYTENPAPNPLVLATMLMRTHARTLFAQLGWGTRTGFQHEEVKRKLELAFAPTARILHFNITRMYRL